ncbi:MAG: rod shape-determining protein MreD [Defluviitaleaceae bacterium]|nr:rod shape-determining protein MreD [Defluviitaleaceae bacterium]
MRIAVMSALILINYVLQTSVLPHVAILGVIPDTALIFIIGYGILRGDIEGAIFGFLAGLLQDVFSGGPIGMFALMGFLIGYISGKPFRDFFKDNYFLPFIIVLVAIILQQFVIYVTSFLFLGYLDFTHYALSIILPTTIYTVSLSIPLYSLLHFINGRIENWESNRRNLFEGDRE